MNYWTKEQEITLINQTQDEYVTELIEILNSSDPSIQALEEVNFTSPTGTGKTKMMSKIINRMPNDYFIITTLSKGQLHQQVHKAISEDCVGTNYKVYGVQSYTKNSLLQDDDILADIQNLPANARVFWFRDEGHIKSNKWMQLLQKRCDKIVNWSATNHDAFGVKCNFVHTMMLRTVQQIPGDIDMALDKLIEVKQQHKGITGYNPCAIIRLTSTALLETVANACKKRKLSYISLLQNDDYDMSELCEDDCAYDVIINQQKIVEGIDIRRAHVLWMENEPVKAATTIQMIGRCRRNALLWRDDVDICAPKNKELLEYTRQCFAFYNEKNMHIAQDESGELAQAFCPIISVEKLKCGATFHVIDGLMSNGLSVEELQGCTGTYTVMQDTETGFHIVNNDAFYAPQYVIEGLLCDYKEPLLWLAELNTFIQKNPKWIEKASSSIHTYIVDNEFISETYVKNKDEVKMVRRQYYLTSQGKFAESRKVLRHIPPALSFCLTARNVCYEHTIPHALAQDQIAIKLRTGDYTLYFSELKTLMKNHQLTLADLDARRFVHQSSYLQPRTRPLPVKSSPIIRCINNRILAEIGPEFWKSIPGSNRKNVDGHIDNLDAWVNDSAITKRIAQHSKLRTLLMQYYSSQYNTACTQCFHRDTPISLPGKVRRLFGSIVEYFAKAQIYGTEYLEPYYSQHVPDEIRYLETDCPENCRLIRACVMKYRANIMAAHQIQSAKFLPSISLEALLKPQMQEFVELVQHYGTQTAAFLRQYVNESHKTLSPFIYSQYCTGLIDVLSENVIIDIKCTNAITPDMILQVLAYAYFSQFVGGRTITKAIIYEAIANRTLEIDIPPQTCDSVLHNLHNALQARLFEASHLSQSSSSSAARIIFDAESAAQLLRTQCNTMYQQHCVQSLRGVSMTEFLQKAKLTPTLKNTLLAHYEDAGVMFSELCYQKKRVHGIGPSGIERIQTATHRLIPSFMNILGDKLTDFQAAIFTIIKNDVLKDNSNIPIYEHVIQNRVLYDYVWSSLRWKQPFAIHPDMIIQTTIITHECAYWDDEYITSRQNTDTEVPI